MVKVNKGDFIQLEFVGRLKSNNKIFDLTDEDLAKKEKIHNPKANYGPIVVCIGQGQLLKGLEHKIIGREIGKKIRIELTAAQAFGRKNPKLMKTISLTKFKKEKLNPFPGLQVNIDGILATVRSVSGGRVTLDFNHPLAGRDVIYEVKILKKITSLKEQVESLIRMGLGIRDLKVEVKGKNVTLKIKQKLPKEVIKKLEEQLKKIVKLDKLFVSTLE